MRILKATDEDGYAYPDYPDRIHFLVFHDGWCDYLGAHKKVILSAQYAFGPDTEAFDEWIKGNPYWVEVVWDPDMQLAEGL